MKNLSLGGCVVSKNILNGKGKLKWCIRETSVNDLDNGWRFLSSIDTDVFLSDASNMAVCDWSTIITIEPAVMAIYHLPIGTDIMLVEENNIKKFYYTDTGDEVRLSYSNTDN